MCTIHTSSNSNTTANSETTDSIIIDINIITTDRSNIILQLSYYRY